METLTSIVAVITGLLVRLALPIIGTGILIYFLRKLDAHWQTEAQLEPVSMPNTECWKVKGCPPEQQQNCPAARSALPCWQVHRLPNGYLAEKCISCEVFIAAPLPTLRTEPRRM
jgi:hypothetical protein